MRKFLTSLFGYAFIPSILVAHYYTQHPAFLFVLGTFSFLLLAILAVAIYFLVSDSAALTDKNVESLREFARVPIWKTGVSLVYQTVCCLYLLYAQAFVVFSLFFAISVMAYATRKLCKEIVAKQK
jgi:hypothetical protein